ncbi:MAG TPA: ImmA/IrrE family metallo-endopeptidase [Magnetospirillaceae bacterium]|nr:ImmA/IrrE family metallo-endopeptidase [Magnetospirillaceae bacterium]
MSTLTVDVNPKVLVWARNELGIDVGEVADHLKTDVATVEDWEEHGQELRYSDLKRLATYYKRQIPVFFLKEAPKQIAKPKDYRNLSLKDKGLHKDTLMAIRRTNRYLGVYREAVGVEVIEEQYKWLKSVRNSRVDTSTYLRQVLDAPMAEQRKAAGDNFKFWRQKFEEKLNIFVFQFPIQNQEFDGFSYVESGKPYAITLNSKISDNRKVFTLFHEIGHLIEGESGICFTANNGNAPSNIETKCNQFAAEFLMPEVEIVPPISFEELKSNAKGLGVSAEAYLIRCRTLNLLDEPKYKELMALIQKNNKKIKKKEQKGGPSALLVSKSQRGDKFFDFVLSAYDSQRLSPSTVRDVLGIRVVGLNRQDK